MGRRADRSPPPVPGRSELAPVRHPGRNDFNWLAHRQLTNALAIAARDHARGRLLDIGCGLRPYDELFAPFVDDHIGVDHADSPHSLEKADVIAGIYEIPLDDESFDTVLLCEVLEHIEEPAAALNEIARLLKPGGCLILTTPFVWTLHEEPRDFFRYSPHGLRHLAAGAGFTDVLVTPLSGQWGTLALLGSYAMRASPLKRRLGRALGPIALRAQRLGAWCDERDFRPWLSWNHVMTARKAAGRG